LEKEILERRGCEDASRRGKSHGRNCVIYRVKGGPCATEKITKRTRTEMLHRRTRGKKGGDIKNQEERKRRTLGGKGELPFLEVDASTETAGFPVVDKDHRVIIKKKRAVFFTF